MQLLASACLVSCRQVLQLLRRLHWLLKGKPFFAEDLAVVALAEASCPDSQSKTFPTGPSSGELVGRSMLSLWL